MQKKMGQKVLQKAFLAVLASFGVTATAQSNEPSYTNFGTPGLLEMPTAESGSPDDIVSTFSTSATGGSKTSFSYQLTDRLNASFRYAVFDLYSRNSTAGDIKGTFSTRDRSFDFSYRLTNESKYVPAIAIGMRDFLGTGRFSSEYVVASKSFGPKLIATAGLGWGSMGQNKGFSNPLGVVSDEFKTRPVYVDREFGENVGQGGQLSVNQWFRGDAALFGGIEYQYNDKFALKAEYSSINYPIDTFRNAVDYQSPFNFGVSYRLNDNIEFGASYMYGSEVGLRATYIINPTEREAASGLDAAPAPVRVRTADQRTAATWDRASQPEPAVRAGLTQLLALEGIELVGLEITDRTARLRYQNDRYRSEAQAMGRAARMMTQVIPPSVQTFELEPTQNGLPLSKVTIPRSQIETLENRVGATEGILAASQFDSAGPAEGLVFQDSPEPRFKWGIGPYLGLTVFGGKSAVSLDTGLKSDFEYQISRKLLVSGRASVSALGARAPYKFTDIPNDYANVRTDQAFYGLDGTPVLNNLTVSYVDRLAPAVYGRVTAGYLENMYGGISTEALYAPAGSKLAFGAEVNYAMLRDQDMAFGFAQYRTVRDGNGRRNRVEDGDYSVVTGHLSAYYDAGNGYHAQVDVGRYLAGDFGATFSLDREYENGWRIGGYFTLTDMPFDQFGEGSFDKGIRITIPYDYFIGSPSRKTTSTTLQSLGRDGGAKLAIGERLYEVVRDGRASELTDTWGRFWR